MKIRKFGGKTLSVNTYLQNLASSLVLSESEKSSVTTSVNTIKNRLDNYFSDITEKKIFGSYSRETILPRKADENSDVDIMVVFSNPNGYKPQSFLYRLKKFAEYYYNSSEIYQSSPSLVLELNHIKFELTPSYVTYSTYYIPDGPSNWKSTDPDGFSSVLLQCNKNNGYKIKPVIRLLKHWNIQKNGRDLPSFLLEKTLAEELKYSYFSCSTYTDYLKAGLDKIKYKTDYNKVETAIDYVNKAISYEEQGMPYSAEQEVKKAFP